MGNVEVGAVAARRVRRRLRPAAFLVPLALAAGPAGALETAGYGRMAAGKSGHEAQQCFGLAGAMSKYRFGNECDVYGELSLSHTFAPLADDSRMELVWRGGVFNRNDRKLRFSAPDGRYRNIEAWGRWKDLPWLRGGALWAGRRYYRRNDVHIADFFYWNPTGLGAGVEDIAVGNAGARLHYALFRRGEAGDPRWVTRHDLQLSGLATNPGGTLALGLSVIPRPGHAGAQGGWSLTAQHEQADVFGGLNRLALQYGTGPGTGLGGTGALDVPGARRLRLVERLDWQPTERAGGQAMLAWQRDWRGGRLLQDWLSVGARPSYALTRHFKLVADLGVDAVRARTGGTRWLRKATLAAVFSPAPGFWSRPEVRIFYTDARWNRAAKQAAPPGSALSYSGAFGAATHGSSIGVSVETWW